MAGKILRAAQVTVSEAGEEEVSAESGEGSESEPASEPSEADPDSDQEASE